MAQHYLLSASGEDRHGIVAAVTEALFKLGMNLEDSAMMRLGSEFGIFLIFVSKRPVTESVFDRSFRVLRASHGLSIGIKKISARQALFRSSSRRLFMVSVHGHDRPGIVFRVTKALAHRRFNITDLTTHRTKNGSSSGYILFIEGELASPSALPRLRSDLARLSRSLKTKIDIRPISTEPL